ARESNHRRGIARLDARWQLAEAERYEKAGEWFAAAFHLGQVLRTSPDNAQALRSRLVMALERLPDPDARGDQLALAYLSNNELADYRRTCEHLLLRSTPAGQAGMALSALQRGPLQTVCALRTAT